MVASSINKDLVITAVLDHQELEVSAPFSIYYWEGQALVTGSHLGKAYVEIVPNVKNDI